MLLRDIQDIFDSEKSRERILTADLIQKLIDMEDRPWSEWSRGFPISARKVAMYLKPFGVLPITVRDGYSKRGKGYKKEVFEDAFARYIPSPPDPPLLNRDNVTTQGEQHLQRNSNRDKLENVTDCNSSKPAVSNGCHVVTGCEGGTQKG